MHKPRSIFSMLLVSVLYLQLFTLSSSTEIEHSKSLRIPLAVFNGTMKYACTSIPVEANHSLVAFEPNVKYGAIHHLAIGLCDEPFRETSIWDCFNQDHVCKGKARSVLATRSYTFPLQFHKNVGMYIGTKTKHLVIQVHGRPIDEPNLYASVKVTLSNKRRKFEHGSIINANTGYIPVTSGLFYADSACKWPYNFSVPLTNFSIHAHEHGVAVAGYIIRNKDWIEVGRGNPLYPRETYDIDAKKLAFHPGDIIAARCSFNNKENRSIEFGYETENEMCAFVVHFGIPLDAPTTVQSLGCESSVPGFRWEDHFPNIPITASDTSGDTEQNRFVIANKLPRISV